MRLLLFLDTETTGLWKKGLSDTDPGQPTIVQLAARLVRTDTRECVSSYTRIVKPGGWSIEAEAASVHGIDEHTAHRFGTELWFALANLQDMTDIAHGIVGYALHDFDRPVITAALSRVKGRPDWWTSRGKDMIDVMEAAHRYMRLPGRFGDHKLPSLAEAYEHLIGGVFDRAHHAEGDCIATELVYWSLYDRLGGQDWRIGT